MRKTVSTIIICICLGVIAFAGFKLYGIFKDYHLANLSYASIRDDFTTPAAIEAEEYVNPDDAPVPIDVDWEGLKEINDDIIGWIYVEAEPDISYPVLQGKDNNQYLHTDYTKNYLYAGSIFVDAWNNKDLTDPNTIVYGHHMKSGSMFAKLKNMGSEESYEKSPYFWILTPQGNYRYKIFAAGPLNYSDTNYTLFPRGDENFMPWVGHMKEVSAIHPDVEVDKDDYVIMLSTCYYTGANRYVVLGKCCSTDKPHKIKGAEIEPTEISG